MTESVARLGTIDSARLAARIGLPLLARGLIQRRPAVVGALTRVGADAWPVAELARLRERHGASLLLVPLPRRPIALPLDADAVRRVLSEPEFTAASREKTAALAHFQPHGLLISRGAARDTRRRFTEAVLETAEETHSLAARMSEVVRQESTPLLDDVRARGELRWDPLAETWWRVVRRVVLGDAARDDVDLITTLQRLRSAGNWAYAHPKRRRAMARFHERAAEHLRRAEPGSLAERVAAHAAPGAEPTSQLGHWLFAFDAAGMTAMRTVLLLAAHPEHLRACRADDERLRATRAAVLETLRLYPTTPAILRDSTAETRWGGHTLPAGTAFAVLAPYFHRDPRLPWADAFEPGRWLDGTAAADPTLLPFSGGPAGCPGRNLVLFLVSSFVAEMTRETDFDVALPRPLPPGLDPFHARLRLASRPHAIPGG